MLNKFLHLIFGYAGHRLRPLHHRSSHRLHHRRSTNRSSRRLRPLHHHSSNRLHHRRRSATYRSSRRLHHRRSTHRSSHRGAFFFGAWSAGMNVGWAGAQV